MRKASHWSFFFKNSFILGVEEDIFPHSPDVRLTIWAHRATMRAMEVGNRV